MKKWILLKNKKAYENGKKINPYEAFYKLDVLNYGLIDENAKKIPKESLNIQLYKYLVYRDWKIKGDIVPFYIGFFDNYQERIYRKLFDIIIKRPLKLVFDKDSFLSYCFCGEDLYYRYWLGQYGVYKKEYGSLMIFDLFETQFLIELGSKLLNYNDYLKTINKIKHFFDLYLIFRDWREKGFVVKSGYKFGTSFRLYSREAYPFKTKHSDFLLDLLDKNKMNIFSKKIRVAHSVKKTLLIGLINPKNINIKPDFLVFKKVRGIHKDIHHNYPDFAVYVMKEDDILNSNIIYSLLLKSKEYGIPILLAVVDREGGISYYKISRVVLENSDIFYAAIDWIKL